MGMEQLKENIQEQKAVVNKTNKQINSLELYANKINAIIISLSSIWDANADRDCLLQAMEHCVKDAAEIIYDYSTFSVNAINFLNQIDLLEALAKALIPGKSIKLKSFHTSMSAKKDHGKIYNFSILDISAKDIANLTKQLDEISIETGSINEQIDSILTKHFNYKYSLSNISSRIKKLSADNSKVATALQRMKDLYQATENDISALVNGVVLGGETSGNVNAELQKAYIKEKDKNSYSWPEMIVYPDAYNVNDADVYLKQNNESGSCNLTSNAMMLKRKAYIDQKDDWVNINKDSVRGAAGGLVVKWDYNYEGDNIKYNVKRYPVDTSPQIAKENYITLLAAHPEGIVIWGDRAFRGNPHAILLTDYDEKTDTFYCSDPADSKSKGRIPLQESLYEGDITKATAYWVVEG